MPPETVHSLLGWATAWLAQAGCDTPQLDARLLLQHAAELTREDLILEPHRQVAEDRAKRFRDLVGRRSARQPVSRILGEREFYGRVFRLTPDVLDPRPDTETLVDAALKLMVRGGRIVDLGCGSGAIIVTLLAERPDATGTAVDISPVALDVAGDNARRLGVAARLTLQHGNWFDGLSGRFDLIVSNPPYIPAADIAGLSPDVREHDPAIALSGGADGLDPYRAIAARAAAHLEPDGHVLVEIGAGQADDVEAIFATAGFRAVRRHADLGGHTRCLDFVL